MRRRPISRAAFLRFAARRLALCLAAARRGVAAGTRRGAVRTAGVESGWHTHPGEEVGFIVAGTVEMMIRGQETLTLHAGDGFLIPPRTPHNALDVGPEPGRMLSTYIVEVGQPLATFVREE